MFFSKKADFITPKEFCETFSKVTNSANCSIVNVGNSPFYLCINALLFKKKINKADKIVLPSFTTGTDFTPIIKLGLIPLICDSNIDDLSIDCDYLINILKYHRPKVLILPITLGLVPKMDEIKTICKEYGIILIIEFSNTILSKYSDNLVSDYADISVYTKNTEQLNFHNDLICTKDSELSEIIDIMNKGKSENINSDVLNSLKSLDSISKKRYLNFTLYQDKMIGVIHKPIERINNFISAGGYPIISKEKQVLKKLLLKNNVPVYPFYFVSVNKYPNMLETFSIGKVLNAQKIVNSGFYIPNNHLQTENEINNITNLVNRYFRDNETKNTDRLSCSRFKNVLL